MFRLRSEFVSRLGRYCSVGQRTCHRTTLTAEWRVVLPGLRPGDRPGERHSRSGKVAAARTPEWRVQAPPEPAGTTNQGYLVRAGVAVWLRRHGQHRDCVTFRVARLEGLEPPTGCLAGTATSALRWSAKAHVTYGWPGASRASGE
jgi:hypothetical protein